MLLSSFFLTFLLSSECLSSPIEYGDVRIQSISFPLCYPRLKVTMLFVPYIIPTQSGSDFSKGDLNLDFF
jgi:hypothetical protein